jgi:hypothetical protein
MLGYHNTEPASRGYTLEMRNSTRVLSVVAFLLASAADADAQMTAEAMLRETLRTAFGEMDVARRYRILRQTLHEENGMDITTAHAVPREQLATAVYQAVFRNVSGPPVCARFKVIYEDDAYHDPQFVQSTRTDHLVETKKHLPLLTVYGDLEGVNFNTPRWRLGYLFWEPTPSGDNRCAANAPADLNAWIASRHDTYQDFRRPRP